ncbi:MAG TPA: NlpC/P60 family protein [Gaiellaceae bacterium]|nr:NlpC/P60 family protein [Gaiellaceae bacterium]
MRISRTLIAALALALLAGALLAGDLSAASTKQKLKDKQAQAQAVLDQVNALGARMDAAVEAWNGANYELAQTRAQLVRDRVSLRKADREQKLALAHLRARLVALYESNDDPSTISILLGSGSVSQAIDRIQAAQQISTADHQLAVQTTAARDRYERVAERTSALERRREADVRQRAAQRAKIGGMLAKRKRLLASVQGQVAALQQQEAHEQAVLAAKARAELAARQAEAQRAAEEQAKAAAAAARAAQEKVAAPPPATTTAPTATAADPPPATTTAATTTTTTATTTTAVPPPATGGHPAAASVAMRYLGIKYAWGGASPSTGFDCSGLTMYVFAQLGISLPHYAAAQFGMGSPVAKADLQPGDLVFFDGLDHVGIYIGGGMMVHAPQTGDVVKITPISDFGSRYVGARRI